MNQHEVISKTKELSHEQCDDLYKILRIKQWPSQWKQNSLDVKKSLIRSSVSNTFKSQIEKLTKYIENNLVV